MSLFKRIFGKKKTTETPKVDYSVEDLKVGFILDYDFKSWEVQDIANYEWMDGTKEVEFGIYSGSEKLYLTYSYGTKAISIYREEKINQVWADAKTKLLRNEVQVSDSFLFNNQTFRYLANGEANVTTNVEAFYLENWLFESPDQEELVSFNKYEDNSVEVYVGKKLKNHQIGNILPRE